MPLGRRTREDLNASCRYLIPFPALPPPGIVSTLDPDMIAGGLLLRIQSAIGYIQKRQDVRTFNVPLRSLVHVYALSLPSLHPCEPGSGEKILTQHYL